MSNIIKLRPALGDDLLSDIEKHKDDIVSVALIAVLSSKDHDTEIMEIRAFKDKEKHPYLVAGALQSMIAEVLQEIEDG